MRAHAAILVLLLFPACRGNVGNPESPTLEFRVVAGPASPETGPADRLTVEGQDLELGPAHVFHAQKAWLDADSEGNPALGLEITAEEQDAFRTWTGSIVGKRMAILLDGRALSVSTVQEALPGRGMISPHIGRLPTKEEVQALVRKLGGP